MRRTVSAMAAIGCLLLVSPANAQQAGSTGGVVGKTDKSVSGGEAEQPRARPAKEKGAAPAPGRQEGQVGASCRDIVGTWRWYLGVTRMVFNSDGTVQNSNGVTGSWKCTGAATVSGVYSNQVKESYSISKDGNSLFVSSTWNGGTAFTATRLGQR